VIVITAIVVVTVVVVMMIGVVGGDDAARERRADERGEDGECCEAFQADLQSFSVDSTLAAGPVTDCMRL